MAESPSVTKQGQFSDTRRDYMMDGGWTLGCDSLLFPTDIAFGSYAWSVNCVNRGGIMQTRPKKKRLFSFSGSIAQGICEFVTLDNTQYLVWAIDGLIYYSQYPFNSYSTMTGIQFSSSVTQIYFCAQVQAAHYNPDLTITYQPPVKYLFIQDGINSPAWWDGSTASQPSANTILSGYTFLPVGTQMVASGGRLWVSVGRQVFASDFAIPTRFLEGQYLASASGFQFPRNVTAMLQAPQDSGTFVYTDKGVYSLQSNIVDRTQWQKTPQFQNTITEQFGCVAPFSPIYQHGLPWFWSAKGFLSMDMALQSKITSVVYTRDGEMRRSKAKLSPTLTGICTGIFENVLMVSVPHASQFNRHTWIQDGGIAAKLNTNAGTCWTGIWTGTYPVQYTTLIYNGVEHNYELSYSNGYMQSAGVTQPISIWENFLKLPADDKLTPVRSQFESRMFRMANDEVMQACFVEALISQLSGTVTVSFSIGGIAGLYNLLSTSTLRADVGPFFNAAMMTIYYVFPGQADTVIESYRPQNRYVRSAEVNITANSNSSHMIEVGYNDYIDKGFQILIKWTGNMSLRALKFYYRPFSIPSIGTIPVNESGTPHIVLEAS